MIRVLVVRAGSAGPENGRRLGDFADWFGAALRRHAAADVVDARAPLPDPGSAAGVLVTGSLASVTCPEPWMDALGAWLLRAAERTPVLGVCFGHQLLARALGGAVERCPRGPEAGTVEIRLTAAGRSDPLFAGLPDPLGVQAAHEDEVARLPPGAVVLAENAHTGVQAFAHGPRIRGVQFHPEFDAARCRALCDADPAWLDRERPGATARVIAGVRETPAAAEVLANWAAGLGR